MTVLAELAAALRLLRRRPGLPLLAVLFLSCGMGAAAGVFAVADAALWRPLPLPDADRLVWVQSMDRGEAGDSAPGLVQAWAARTRTLDAVGALRPVQATWRDRSGTDRVEGAQITAGALSALGLTAARGRVLAADDERAGGVVMLTHRLWSARFGGRPDIVGEAIEIDGRGRTVVGVLAPDADHLPFGGDWFVPLALDGAPSGTGPRYLDVVGRLAPGSSPDDAERELSALASEVGAAGETGSPLTARVRRLAEPFNQGAARVLQPLLAAALLVLLIAAVNTTSLRLAEHQQRRTEMAVRAALGAGRSRLMGGLLAEAAVIALAAGGLGLILAQWCIAALIALLPAGTLRGSAVHVDARVVLFTAGLAAAVALLAGLLPAWRHTRGEIAHAVLKQARGVMGGDDRLRRVLVVAQIALAMTLGTAGAVMVRTNWSLADASRSYRSAAVWTAAIRLSNADYPAAPDMTAAVERVRERVAALPGVERVAVASRVPLAGGSPGSDVALAHDAFTPGTDRQTRIRFVTPGYFAAVGSPLIDGRDVSRGDVAGGAPVVLVNETLAARLSPARSPVGEFVRFAVQDFNGPTPTPWRIVGVVQDLQDRGPRQAAEPEVYVSLAQGPPGVFDWIGRQLLLIVRMTPGAVLAPATLRTAVNAADPRIPAFDVRTLDDRFQGHIAVERLLTGLLVPLAGAGFLLAGFGVFAVVMHAVHQRRREMALRMVLGASPGDVMREIGQTALVLLTGGVAAGLGGALASAHVLRTVSFGVSPLDPGVMATVIVAVASTTLLAVWIPARRAARHDPAVVLRAE